MKQSWSLLVVLTLVALFLTAPGSVLAQAEEGDVVVGDLTVGDAVRANTEEVVVEFEKQFRTLTGLVLEADSTPRECPPEVYCAYHKLHRHRQLSELVTDDLIGQIIVDMCGAAGALTLDHMGFVQRETTRRIQAIIDSHPDCFVSPFLIDPFGPENSCEIEPVGLTPDNCRERAKEISGSSDQTSVDPCDLCQS